MGHPGGASPDPEQVMGSCGPEGHNCRRRQDVHDNRRQQQDDPAVAGHHRREPRCRAGGPQAAGEGKCRKPDPIARSSLKLKTDTRQVNPDTPRGEDPMSARTTDDAARVLANPLAYTDEAGLHEALTHLRAHAPVSWVDAPPYRPFWAVTKHADIMDIERGQRTLHQFAEAATDHRGGRRRAACPTGGRRGATHADPHGRSATP